ncbi:MAG: hypothetical protein ACOH5I_07630 [Oligoflexus sp.]
MLKFFGMPIVVLSLLAACGSKENEEKIFVSDPQLEQQLIDAQAEIERLEKDLADKDKTVEESQNNLALMQSSVDTLTEEVERLEEEEETFLRLMLSAGDAKELEKTKELLTNTQKYLESTRVALKDAETKLGELDANYKETKKQLKLAEAQRSGMQSFAQEQMSLILSTTHELLVFMESRGVSSYQEANEILITELADLSAEDGLLGQWEIQLKEKKIEQKEVLRALQDQQAVIATLNRDLKQLVARGADFLDDDLLAAYREYHTQTLRVEKLEKQLKLFSNQLNLTLAQKDQLEVALSELDSRYASLAAQLAKGENLPAEESPETLQEELLIIDEERRKVEEQVQETELKAQDLFSKESAVKELLLVHENLLMAKAEVLDELQGLRVSTALALRAVLLAEYQKLTAEWKAINTSLTEGKVKAVQFDLFLKILDLFKKSAKDATEAPATEDDQADES